MGLGKENGQDFGEKAETFQVEAIMDLFRCELVENPQEVVEPLFLTEFDAPILADRASEGKFNKKKDGALLRVENVINDLQTVHELPVA